MTDPSRTNQELLEEISVLKQKIQEMEQLKSERKRAEEALQYREKLERIITDISSEFINLRSDEIDRAIHQALELIAMFTGADRSYLFFFRDGGNAFDNTHEWCAEGIESHRHRLQGLRVENFPHVSRSLKRSEVVHIPRVADLPEQSGFDKKEFELEGIQSLVLVPIEFKKVVIGFLGLDAVHREKSWAQDIVALLRIAGEVFAGALERKQAEEELNEKSQFIASLLRAIPVAVFYKDKEGRYLGCNNAFTEIMGVTSNEINGKTVHELWPSELAEKYHQMDLELMRHRQHQRYEFKVKAKDGEMHPVIYVKDVYLDNHGEVAGLVGAFVDITERKRTEEALRKNEEQYRLIAENTADLISVLDMNLRFTYVSPASMRLRGYTAEEAMQQTIDQVLTPESMQLGLSIFEEEMQLEASGMADPDRTRILELEEYRKDGSTVWVEVNLSFLRDKDRKPVGILIVTRDISERKLAEGRLVESEDRFNRAITGTGAGLWDWDMVKNTVFFSRQWKSMLGYADHEVENDFSGWKNLWHPEDAARIEKAVNDYIEARTTVYEVEHRLRHKDGSWHWILTRGDIERDAAGKPFRWTGTNIDITERKQVEKEQEKLKEQLNQAQKIEAIGQLAGGVAHDFNNMLNIILGYSQLALIKIEPSSPLKADLQEIINATQRSTELVRQLLAFARKQTISPKVLDLNDIVAGMLNMLQRLIGEDIDLLWMPAANLWQVKIDPAQVDQILANLAVNARDSISGVGKITIETGNMELDEVYCSQYTDFVPGQYILLAVSDNGCGMDEDTCKQIFEPFFTTKEIGKGTGMGLATVYGIVKQNNGFINVYSEPGKGTTFKIYLPRFEEEGTTIAEPRTHAKSPTGTETVLLVEDNEALLKMSKMMLEELGYKVLAADSPNEAIKLTEQYEGDINLVLTDVVMPEMSGRDLQKRLSALRTDIKYLFMSGYTSNVIAHRGILDEGVNFLEKPFHMEVLATKVRETLEQQ